MTDTAPRVYHPPLRPRVDYFGRPVVIDWCPDCTRYFHQAHDCADWRRDTEETPCAD